MSNSGPRPLRGDVTGMMWTGSVRVLVSVGLLPLSTVAVPVGETDRAPVSVRWTGWAVPAGLTSLTKSAPVLLSRVTLSKTVSPASRAAGMTTSPRKSRNIFWA